MNLTLLSTDVPLTKTITKNTDGSLSKDSYPMRKNFTSTTVKASNLNDLFKHIKAQSLSPIKPCLLKGTILKELVNESRAGATTSSTTTQFIVLDLDRAPFNCPDEFMKAIGLDDTSYIVQYSSSYKLDPKDKTLSCHIFCWLSSPMSALILKAWLMHLNLSTPTLKEAISLSTAGHALHWSLDITVCQNDKLIYIAEPTFIGMKSPIPPAERMQLVPREHQAIDITTLNPPLIGASQKIARTVLNSLRTAAGLDTLRKTTMVGEHEVQKGVGEVTSYEVFDDGVSDFIYFNLNGGDSKAYYHPRNDLTLLHNFKGEPFPYIKDILPGYYADRMRDRNAANATPNESGDVVLAFRDKITSKYWVGTWNKSTQLLDINRVDNKDMLEDFQRSHSLTPGAFVPIWSLTYNPQNPTILDEDNHVINTFRPSKYMAPASQQEGDFPNITKLLDSCVGTGVIREHHLDWMAHIFQTRSKAEVAWTLQGVFGTGKGMYVSDVVAPLFGRNNVHSMRANELSEKFNGWIENALIVFVDEIEADMFTNPKGVESDMKNFITDSPLTIRRMRTDAYMAENYANFIFGSNNKTQPVRIPMGDRRHNVAAFQPVQFFPTDAEVEAIRSDKELSAFAYHLQHRVTSAKVARTVMQTAERMAIQELSVTSVDELANNIITGNLSGLLDAMPDEATIHEQAGSGNYTASNFMNLIRRFAAEGKSNISNDEMKVIFEHCIGNAPSGVMKLTKYLTHHGIIKKSVRITGRPVFKAYQVEWKDADEVCDKLAQQQPTKLKAVK